MFAPDHIAQTVLGLLVWAIWFVVFYGGLSVACEVNPPDVSLGAFTWLNAGLGLLTLGTATLLIWFSSRCLRMYRAEGRQQKNRSQNNFVLSVATACHLMAAGAVLLGGLPVAALPPCL